MNGLIRPITLPGLSIDFPVALGPMAGITDMSGREVAAEQGCGLFYTEMVSAKALSYNNKNTEALLRRGTLDTPLGVQLFGSDPDVIAEEAAKLEERFDFIDFNMGCPVPKIVKNHEGSYLLTQPKLVEAIFTKLVNAVKKPVTAKIRVGFREGSEEGKEIARILESCGVSMIAVHGRTRDQYYSGKADLDAIRRVRESVKIPVIGNGDIRTAFDAERMMLETGVDGVMAARGADGNPWLFREIRSYFTTGTIPEKPTFHEVRSMILHHASLLMEEKGEATALREMRRHAAAYLHGMTGASKMRVRIGSVSTMEELNAVLSAEIPEET